MTNARIVHTTKGRFLELTDLCFVASPSGVTAPLTDELFEALQSAVDGEEAWRSAEAELNA